MSCVKHLDGAPKDKGEMQKGVPKSTSPIGLNSHLPKGMKWSGDLSRAVPSTCLWFCSVVHWFTEEEAVLVLAQLLCPHVPD